MLIRVNGEERDVKEGFSLGALLSELKISTIGTAVELNLEVVPKKSYDDRALEEGDVVEIIRMVGGG